eukprot:3103214-Karenia_brevis.AAC.1
MVQNLRTIGADAVASTEHCRCPIIAITVAKGIKWDPWVRGPVNTITHMIGIINGWDGNVGKQ